MVYSLIRNTSSSEESPTAGRCIRDRWFSHTEGHCRPHPFGPNRPPAYILTGVYSSPTTGGLYPVILWLSGSRVRVPPCRSSNSSRIVRLSVIVSLWPVMVFLPFFCPFKTPLIMSFTGSVVSILRFHPQLGTGGDADALGLVFRSQHQHTAVNERHFRTFIRPCHLLSSFHLVTF